MNIDLKFFLEDTTTYLQKIGENFYSKVPYNKNLILLYKGDSFGFKKSEMDLMGVYSLSKSEFLAISDDYHAKRVCDNDLTMEVLNRDLDERIQNELLAILEQIVKPSAVLSNEVLEEAKEYKIKGEEPLFSFHGYKNAEITLENIEVFYTDKDDYAYSIAEQVVQNQEECIRQYQRYVDIMVALTQFSKNIPIDIQIEMAIKEIKMDSHYKNLKAYVIKDRAIQEENVTTRDLQDYPLYAFDKIYWGRKLIFDIRDYDENEINSLRTSAEFHINMLANMDIYRHNKVWDYIDKRMYSNYDFAIAICRYYKREYERIDESFRGNMTFIQNSGVDGFYLLHYTPEDVIMNNKMYFMNLLEKDAESFCYLPEKAPKDIDFICIYIRKKGSSAIYSLPEEVFLYDKVQKAFDEWFLENPTPINQSYYKVSDVKISLLKNRDTKVYALNIPYIAALDDNDLNDETLIIDFLKRLEVLYSSKSIKADDNTFVSIYKNLKDLKTSDTIVQTLMSLCNIGEAAWNVLDDSMKTRDRQREFVEHCSELLYKMDNDIMLEFVYANPKKYLPYMQKRKSYSGYNRKPILKPANFDEDLILDLIKKNGDDLSFLEDLSYSQKSDEKFARKMMNINKKVYRYLDSSLRNNKNFAMDAVTEFSVIPYLPKKTKWSESLFDDKEVMEASLNHTPLDFSDIPQASRQIGAAPLLSSKEFILYAVKLDSSNACYIDPKTGFLEDEDVCYEAVIDDINTVRAFAGKLFRNEEFVYRLCEGLQKKIDILKSREIKEIWYREINEKIMSLVPKKIKGTNTFLAKFPMFA